MKSLKEVANNLNYYSFGNVPSPWVSTHKNIEPNDFEKSIMALTDYEGGIFYRCGTYNGGSYLEVDRPVFLFKKLDSEIILTYNREWRDKTKRFYIVHDIYKSAISESKDWRKLFDAVHAISRQWTQNGFSPNKVGKVSGRKLDAWTTYTNNLFTEALAMYHAQSAAKNQAIQHLKDMALSSGAEITELKRDKTTYILANDFFHIEVVISDIGSTYPTIRFKKDLETALNLKLSKS